MAEVLRIPFGPGLSNTLDRVLVSQNGIFSMDSVKVDNSVLEVESGYSVQISTGAGTGQGLHIFKFEGTEEYLKVDGGNVFVASPTATAFTQIATSVGAGKWFFQQQGNTLYAVNEGSAGIARHTIGDTDWTVAGSTSPASGETLYPVEGFFGFTGPASGFYNIGPGSDVASGWTFGHPSGTIGGDDEVTYLELRTNQWVFDLNRSYGGGGDSISYTFEFDTAQDFSESHHWRLRKTMTSARNTTWDEDSFYIEFEDSNGKITSPTSFGTQEDVSPGTHAPTTSRNMYFAGLDEELADVKKIHIYSYFSTVRTGSNAQVFITLFRGDVAMNDNSSVDLDAGAIQDAIRYRYTLTASGGLESNLSQNSIASPFVPSNQGMQSCFLRVGMDVVATGASGDVLNLYRQIKSTQAWARIGSALNDGTPFTATNATGTLFVDDTNQEWELSSLPTYDAGFQLDINEDETQSIGKFKASLCIGAGKNLYISKVARYTEFEAIGSAPNPNDFNQGRSVFVDDTQSEDVNMVVGLDVMYVGTRSRIYAMVPRGDGFPKDLTSPRPITNSGPFGPRAFTVFEDGIAYVDRNAVWFIRYNGETTVDDTGAVEAQELTSDVRTSFNDLSIDTDVVLVVQDGDLLLFQGTKYMRLSRTNRVWTSGTLNHIIVDAAPDFANDLRLLTDDGQLLRWDNGTTFGGSAITWSATIGDITLPRSRILYIRVIAEGSPVLTMTAFDGLDGSNVQPLTLEDDENVIEPFEAGQAYGSRFRFAFTGGKDDKVKGIEFLYELIQTGKNK